MFQQFPDEREQHSPDKQEQYLSTTEGQESRRPKQSSAEAAVTSKRTIPPGTVLPPLALTKK